MKKSDIKRLRKVIDHVEKSISLLEVLYDNTDKWQHYRVQQHLRALVEERSSLEIFLRCMESNPEFQHRDFFEN